MTDGYYVDPANYRPDNNPSSPPSAGSNEPNPRQRVIRTVAQVIIAVLVAIPTAWGALAAAGVEIAPEVTAWVIGIPSALVILISAGQNAVDARRSRP